MTLPTILKSIKGRDVGLDNAGYLSARLGMRTPRLEFDVTALSSAANATNGGVGILSSTAAQSVTMDAPAAGAIKHLFMNSTSTSTAARTVTLASGNFQSTASSTYTSITFNGPGQSAMLAGQSTSRFQVMANNGALLA